MTNTPWGMSQSVSRFGLGVNFYSTARHGGFHVSEKINLMINRTWRNDNGWYEEDCEASIVILTFSNRFTPEQVTRAHESAKNWYPHAYETVFDVQVKPEESSVLRAEKFRVDHANDYVGMSAWGSWYETVPTGFVGVFAGRGGRTETGAFPADTKYFLVPEDEYNTRTEGGFVIDENKHELWIDHPDSGTKRIG